MFISRSTVPKKRRARSRFSDEYGVLLQLLIDARKSAGITQEQIAKHLGKTQSHVSMCELREREISIIDLMKWCDAIGITMSDFVLQFQQILASKRPKKR